MTPEEKARQTIDRLLIEAGWVIQEYLALLQTKIAPAHIGCQQHLCRGETAGRDELFKMIFRSLAQFYVDTRLRFEGVTPAPLMRIRTALRRLLRG